MILVQEYKVNGNTVRIHGELNMELIRKETEAFMKKAERKRRENKKKKKCA